MLLFALLACDQTGTLTVKLEYGWGASQLVPRYYGEMIPVHLAGEEMGSVGDELELPPTAAGEAFDVSFGYQDRFTAEGLPLYSIFGQDNEWWVSPPAQAQVKLGENTLLVVAAHRYLKGDWSCRRLFVSDSDITTGPVHMEGVAMLTLEGMTPLTVDGDVVHAELDNGELWGYFPEHDVLLVRHYTDGIGYTDYARCWDAARGSEPVWTDYPMDDVVAQE